MYADHENTKIARHDIPSSNTLSDSGSLAQRYDWHVGRENYEYECESCLHFE